MRYIYNGRHLYHSVEGLQHLEPASQSVYDPHKYGLPELKKYPMPDAAHVKSAIRFFNYVSPKYEKQLAGAIIKRMKEYGVTDIEVGPHNRFGKYYKSSSVLEHSSVNKYGMDYVTYTDSSNILQHSTGTWEKHDYVDKVRDPKTGGWRYIYDGQDANMIGSRNGTGQESDSNDGIQNPNTLGSNSNIHSYNQGVVNKQKVTKEEYTTKHERAAEISKGLQDTMNKTVEEVTGKSSKKGSGSSKKGSSSKNGSSGGIVGIKANPGHVSSSSKSTSSSDAETLNSKNVAESKAAKKAQRVSSQKSKQQATSNDNKANALKAEAEKEAATRRNNVNSTTMTNDTLNNLLNMLSDENKEKAKKLIETKSTSAADKYLEYVQNKYNSESSSKWLNEIKNAQSLRGTGRTTINNDTLDQIKNMLDESKKKQAESLLAGKNKVDEILEKMRSK